MAGKPCDCLAVRRMIRDIEEDSLERTGGHVRYVPYRTVRTDTVRMYSVCTYCIYSVLTVSVRTAFTQYFALHQIPYRIIVQYSTAQYRAEQYSTLQYSIVQYSIVLYITV